MARNDGMVEVNSNYEPLISGPMDARLSVSKYVDLYTDSSFNTTWVWQGMQVSVTDDGDNNGVYELVDVEQIHSEYGWSKVMTIKDIEEEEWVLDGSIDVL